MSKKPVIAITAGEVQNTVETWASITVGQSYPYVQAIVHAGGVPFILPITEDETVRRQLYELADGVLFAGGNDIDPTRYGQQPVAEIGSLSEARDSQEWQLLQWAIQDNKPLLAICRGMQLLNVVRGGDLYQHIPSDLPASENHETSKEHQDTSYLAHTLRLEPRSRLATILQTDDVRSNSQHHQAVHKLGASLTATAWAEDGIVEAIELDDKAFAIGVQSHPEGLESAIEPVWRLLFQAFVTAAAS